MTNVAFDEEEERRQEWIDHYISTGELDKARQLGWSEEEMPHWKQHEIQQQAETQAAIPTMMDLENLQSTFLRSLTTCFLCHTIIKTEKIEIHKGIIILNR